MANQRDLDLVNLMSEDMGDIGATTAAPAASAGPVAAPAAAPAPAANASQWNRQGNFLVSNQIATVPQSVKDQLVASNKVIGSRVFGVSGGGIKVGDKEYALDQQGNVREVMFSDNPSFLDIVAQIATPIVFSALPGAIAPTIASTLGVSTQVANVIANAAVQATSQIAATGEIDPKALALQAVSTVVSPMVGREVATQVNDAYQSLTGQALSNQVQNAVANAAGSAAGTAIKGGETSDVLQNTVAGAVASGLRDAGVNEGVARTVGMYISTGNVATSIISGVAREVASSSPGGEAVAAAPSAAAAAGRTELVQTETLPDGRTIEVESDGNIRVVDAQGFEKLIGTTADLAAGQSLADFAQQKLADMTATTAAAAPVSAPTGVQTVETTGNRFTLPDTTEVTIQNDGTISAIRGNKQVLLGNVADVPAGSTVQQFAQQQADVKLPAEAPAAAPAPAQQVAVTGTLGAQDQQILDTIAEERATPSALISAPQEKANAAVQQIEVTGAAAPATQEILDVITPTGQPEGVLEPTIPPPSPQQVTVTGQALPRDVIDVLEMAGIDYGATEPQRVEVTAPAAPAAQVVDVTAPAAAPATEAERVEVTAPAPAPREVIDETQRVEVTGEQPKQLIDEVQRVEVTGEAPRDIVDETQTVEVTGGLPKDIVEEVSTPESRLELYTQPRPKRRAPSTLARTLQAPTIGTGITQGLGAARAPGEIESEVTGKRRRNVWNEASLRLKDALGI